MQDPKNIRAQAEIIQTGRRRGIYAGIGGNVAIIQSMIFIFERLAIISGYSEVTYTRSTPHYIRRKMNSEERRIASEQIGYSHCNISSNVMMVKVSEVEELLSGAESKYRTSAGFEGSYMPSLERNSSQTQHGGTSGIMSFTSQSGRSSKKNWISSIPNYSYHLDPVPSASPVIHHRLGTKKLKSFPTL